MYIYIDNCKYFCTDIALSLNTPLTALPFTEQQSLWQRLAMKLAGHISPQPHGKPHRNIRILRTIPFESFDSGCGPLLELEQNCDVKLEVYIGMSLETSTPQMRKAQCTCRVTATYRNEFPSSWKTAVPCRMDGCSTRKRHLQQD